MKFVLLAVLVALALTLPATAAPMTKAQLNANVLKSNHAPPARFNHKPTVPFTLDVVPHWQIELVCGKAERKGDVRPACTSTGPKGTWIFVSDWLTGRALKAVMRHEYGHVNGWSQRHER
ncbi:MAG TPA: hypothetical protein VM512_16975 [Burkholderiaceae bacterium]|nr:hypothetical protein [Burkholderiaceae bacterium]